MNLHNVVRRLINIVNPDTKSDIWVSTGNEINDDGTTKPIYSILEGITIQLQPVSSDILKQINNISMQGLLKQVYVNDNYYAQMRLLNKGGDIFVIGDQKWLVVKDIELWPDWCRVLIQLQVD